MVSGGQQRGHPSILKEEQGMKKAQVWKGRPFTDFEKCQGAGSQVPDLWASALMSALDGGLSWVTGMLVSPGSHQVVPRLGGGTVAEVGLCPIWHFLGS